jgi:hypothetical protein
VATQEASRRGTGRVLGRVMEVARVVTRRYYDG